MGILSDREITELVSIEPKAPMQHRPGVISYGVTSYGYDARLGYNFKVFKPYPCSVIDPKNFNNDMLESVDKTPAIPGAPAEPLLIPPHSFVLAETLEVFDIPRDVLCVVLGKSTYARCGLIVNVTPLEPEWKGRVTVELSNTTPLPLAVYPGEGIMQCLFFTSNLRKEYINALLFKFLTDSQAYTKQDLDMMFGEYLSASCEVSYKDKKGKYQNQAGLQVPIVLNTQETDRLDVISQIMNYAGAANK